MATKLGMFYWISHCYLFRTTVSICQRIVRENREAIKLVVQRSIPKAPPSSFVKKSDLVLTSPDLNRQSKGPKCRLTALRNSRPFTGHSTACEADSHTLVKKFLAFYGKAHYLVYKRP